MFYKFILLNVLIVGVFCCCSHDDHSRSKVLLDGRWQFAMDTASVGESEKWYLTDLADSVQLPGTTDLNKKSHKNSYHCNCLVNVMKKPLHKECHPYQDTTAYHYTREYPFVGKAWYRRTIDVPRSFCDKNIFLTLERTKVTKVWIDDQYIGENKLLSAKQIFDVTKHLTPGMHHLTIMVDNDPKLVPTGLSHIYSYDTQTNWNGILGEISLTARPSCFVARTDVFPNVKNREAQIRLRIKNTSKATQKVKIALSAHSWNVDEKQELATKEFSAIITTSDTVLCYTYPMGNAPLLWSEFTPALYRINVSLENQDEQLDKVEVSFGMRDFFAHGSQFSINGHTIFLRGKHDGCVFPLTGHPPVDTTEWCRYFRICKDYGINHVRFHSWCPPQAAFLAADVTGVYVQAELPYWGYYGEQDSSLVAFMMNEANEIMEQNGNSPSFCMFSLGNELSGSRKVMDQIVGDLKASFPRQLYSFGTNSVFNDPNPGENDDFWPTVWTNGKAHANAENHVRSSFATNEDETGGLINAFEPSTVRNYSKAIENYHLPIIGHEIGQFQIYPDYNELEKYKGVLKPLNYEVFQQNLERAGMGHQADAFFKSTGQSCLIQYREEIEAALRTPDFGGFQILDLQDYPGQATALVGILDPFMDSKGIITPQKFREFCSEVVPLLEMEKYCYSDSDHFSAKVLVANYSFSDLNSSTIKWVARVQRDSSILAKGDIVPKDIPAGELSLIGDISLVLNKIINPEKIIISIEIEGTTYRNEYPIWVYPSKRPQVEVNGVLVANAVTPEVLSTLNRGGNVLLMPDHERIKDHSVAPQFINEFWNWYMFRGICSSNNRPLSAGTMGLLVDPQHPLFKNFPTEMHSNWQWWHIMKSSRPYILDGFLGEVEPVVQVIDNVYRNHKLGTVFEFKCGKGKVLVCTAQLRSIIDKPEVAQFLSCLADYAASEQFNPEIEMGVTQIKSLF